MILIAVAGIIVILTQLLGIKRSNKRDLFHLLAVLLSAAGAYVITVLFGDKLFAFAENRHWFDIETPFLRQIVMAAVKPALIAVLFTGLLIVLGLIFHFIAYSRKPKKPNAIVKILLNLISGVIIAIVFIVPVDYYVSNTDKFIDILEAYEYNVGDELPDLEKYRLGSDIPASLTAELTKVEFEGQTYSIQKCAECAKGFSALADYSGSGEDLNDLISALDGDEETEKLYEIFVSELPDTVQDPKMKAVLSQEGRVSSKLRALSMLSQLKDMLGGKLDCHEALKTMIETADKDACEAFASLCTFQELKTTNYKGGLNAPFIAEIIKGMPDIPDKSPEGVDREARSVAYIMNIDPSDQQSGFNYNDLDPDLVAKCINDSYLLQNAYITITDHGTIKDPCGVTSNGSVLNPLVFDYYVSTIIYRLDKTYGFHPDSDLYKSMMAFFDVKEI